MNFGKLLEVDGGGNAFYRVDSASPKNVPKSHRTHDHQMMLLDRVL